MKNYLKFSSIFINSWNDLLYGTMDRSRRMILNFDNLVINNEQKMILFT